MKRFISFYYYYYVAYMPLLMFYVCCFLALFCFVFSSYNRLEKVADYLNFSKSRLMDQQGLIWTPAMKVKELNGTLNAIKLRNNSNLVLVRANMDHFLLLDKFWNRCRHRHHLSSGFYFVNSALDLCDEVHLYGFWPFSNSLHNQTIPVHYYDSVNITGQHDVSHELKLLLTMHRLGMLRFHMDDCSGKNPNNDKMEQKNTNSRKQSTKSEQQKRTHKPSPNVSNFKT